MQKHEIDYLELACAGHLEKRLPSSRLRLWADAFSTSGQTKTRVEMFFGTRNWVYQYGSFDPSQSRSLSLRLYTLDIQLTLYTLQNHSEAMAVMHAAMNTLDGYQPYQEFEPIRPVRAGDARFDAPNGKWIYTGECTALLVPNDGKITPISNIIEPSIVQVGLYNQSATPERQLDAQFA
jgi:hypothetical protein